MRRVCVVLRFAAPAVTPRSAQSESLNPDQLRMALLQFRKFVCTASPVFATNCTLLYSPNARNLLSPSTPSTPSDLATFCSLSVAYLPHRAAPYSDVSLRSLTVRRPEFNQYSHS
ncbi:hypothetical protein F5Y09DRAFT_247628 [Xylaria sp. FL1042]|nr:hypothetical protein F5Y09DRAFT_247628 [Xylaria sp. FL1042]